LVILVNQVISSIQQNLGLAIIKAILESKDLINAIETDGRGKKCVKAIALDVFPWNGQINLSFRESNCDEANRYSIANWKYYCFVSEQSSLVLMPIADQMQELWETPPTGVEQDEMAHLLFMTAAQSLLDKNVSECLNNFGINAPYISEGIGSSFFEYLVLDGDGSIRSNYCDIVRANRTTERILRILEFDARR